MTLRLDGGWVAISWTQGLRPLSSLGQAASAFMNSCTGLPGKLSPENVFFCYKKSDTQAVNSKTMNKMLFSSFFYAVYACTQTPHSLLFAMFYFACSNLYFFFTLRKNYSSTQSLISSRAEQKQQSLILCEKSQTNKNCVCLIILLGPFKALGKMDMCIFSL